MSDDEDCVGLPMIYVNLSAADTGSFTIPSAGELASERLREDENERRLRVLQELETVVGEGEVGEAWGGGRQDSSSSESDAGLARAVSALHVEARALCGRAGREGGAGRLLAHLSARLPAGARALLERPAVGCHLHSVVDHVSALVCADDDSWTDDDALAAGALLSAAALWAAPAAPALRALHVLLEERASPAARDALLHALLDALSERERLRLGDALAAGGGECARLAERVRCAALLGLVGGEAQHVGDALRAGWGTLDAERRYAALQLLGRRLAAGGGGEGEGASLLAALGAAGGEARAPAGLKVLVAASKLRLLFAPDE